MRWMVWTHERTASSRRETRGPAQARPRTFTQDGQLHAQIGPGEHMVPRHEADGVSTRWIQLVADVALDLIDVDVDAIGGLTMGADPVAFGIAAVAATRGRSLRSFSVRKESKDHGIRGRIAGALQPGDRVAVVEDTVTRGTSIFEAVEAIKEFGATPVVITVIVDRGGTCAAMSAEAGITYAPMLTAPDLGYSFGS